MHYKNHYCTCLWRLNPKSFLGRTMPRNHHLRVGHEGQRYQALLLPAYAGHTVEGPETQCLPKSPSSLFQSSSPGCCKELPLHASMAALVFSIANSVSLHIFPKFYCPSIHPSRQPSSLHISFFCGSHSWKNSVQVKLLVTADPPHTVKPSSRNTK